MSQNLKSRSWNRLGSALTCAAIAGFVLTSLYAKWNPAQGQEKQTKNDDQKGKKAAQKKTAKAPTNLVVPGAGKKLDALALAAIIDQEVNKRLTAEGIKA